MSIINHPAPEISETLAREIGFTHFGLEGPVARLASERDQNFHFGGNGGGAVLKIVNAAEPDEALRFQVAMIGHIKRIDPALAVPPVRLSRSGEELPVIEIGKGERHLIRAVDYLEGHAPGRGAEITGAARELRQLPRPARPGASELSAIRAPIAISTGTCARPAARGHRLEALIDPEEREICDYFLDRFETSVEPQLAALRASVIHNDANDWNVLVADRRAGDFRPHRFRRCAAYRAHLRDGGGRGLCHPRCR